MKKLLSFLFIAIVITAVLRVDLYKLATDLGGEYTAYVTDGEGTPVFSVDGEGVFSTTEGQSDAVAETLTFPADTNVDELLKKIGAVYTFSDDVGDVKVIHGFALRLKRIRLINKKPVNFQITVSPAAVTLSCPVNLGSF